MLKTALRYEKEIIQKENPWLFRTCMDFSRDATVSEAGGCIRYLPAKAAEMRAERQK